MRWKLIITVAGLLAAADNHAMSAADRLAGTPAKDSASNNLFVSPSGKPFRGKPADPYAVGLWYHEADKDGDGRLTIKEFVGDTAAYFSTLDLDRDGELGVAEVRRYENELVPEIQPDLVMAPTSGQPTMRPFRGSPGASRGGNQMAGPSGGPAGSAGSRGKPSHTGLAAYTLLGVTHPLLSADADMNRGVSRDEFQAAARRRFVALDRNADGALVLAELPATAAQAGFVKR